MPTHIQFKLRSLLGALPDNVLAHPRAEIGQHVNLDRTIPLPTDIIIPQLATARVTMPLATVLDALPIELLNPARRSPGDATIVLPLHEIVTQLPPRFFTTRISQRSVLEIGEEVPTPFQERKPTPPPQPVAPPPAPVPESHPPTPPPTPAPEPVKLAPEPAPVEIAASVPPPEPVATPAPVVQPEPVVEPEPAAPEPAPAPVEAAPPPSEPVKEPAPTVTEPEAVPAVAAEQPPSGPLDEKSFLINLNRCSVEDLTAIKNVGPALARRIIAWRNEHGHFNTIEDLRQVPGVGRKTFRALAGAKAQAINRLLGVAEDRDLTLQEIVRLTSKLPGLQGCMLATADGLLLTGEVPPHFDRDAVSVFAPQLFRRVSRYTKELKVGQVSRFTVFTDQQPITIFGVDEVYLVVFHDSKHFSKRLLRQCERVSAEIARLCRQRITV